MRKPLIVGNWKMYKTINEAIQLVTLLKRQLADFTAADIAVCPAFTALSPVFEALMQTEIKIGAQDLYWQKEGAFTGEISPIMLKDAGCEYVIIGHSERRKLFNETDENVNKKVDAALAVGLTPIMCVGETLQERETEKTFEIIETQLIGGLKDMTADEMERIVIAYEPVWAIGTGKTATAEQAQEVHCFIRKWIAKIYNQIADQVCVLYGGSVKPNNINELMSEPDIDGALVGGASLDADSFTQIVKNAIVSK